MIRVRDHKRYVFAMVALFAITLRAMLPAGFMLAPDPQSDRYLTVTLCAVHGSVAQVLDLETGALLPETPAAPNQPVPDERESPCVFAAIATLAAPINSGDMLVALKQTKPDHTPLLAAMASDRGLAAPPPFPTGPPASPSV